MEHVLDRPPDQTDGPNQPPNAPSFRQQDPYRGAVLVLLPVALIGAAAMLIAGVLIGSVVFLDATVTLGLAAAVLAGVACAQAARTREFRSGEATTTPRLAEQTDPAANGEVAREKRTLKARLAAACRRIWRGLSRIDWARAIRLGAAVMGAAAIVLLLVLATPAVAPLPMMLGIAAGISLGGTALAATAARYLADVQRTDFPEALGLCRGARVVAWVLLVAALSVGLQAVALPTALQVLHFILLILNAAICVGLLVAKPSATGVVETFPLDLSVLSILGGRANILGSMLDNAERQLGIDLRSTWALVVVRRTIEPLVIALCFLGWLGTSLTVIGVSDEGLVERLGVPLPGAPLQSGLHLHWPWPIDRVYRIPVRRVQALTVGHEGEEEGGGPENVLWAVEHAPNEYTLLLGNGRDLITIDAAVQYRIVDPRAWRYNSQNPTDALKAIAYRAVMRNTVNRTLSDALSENVVTLTERMRHMVQQDSDAQGLGAEIVGFTVGGMHPPVPVAGDYEAVVSAQLRMATSVADAETFRNQTVPAAVSGALVNENTAKANGAEMLAKAAGEAWSFRTLESQYRAAPQEYFFRRRLETLDNVLAGRGFTIVDTRIQKDGGELWLIP
jgi:regulator of protease activity HflC (stomatin/prohibitin superfamily)